MKNTYSEMKESGVAWIGAVPSNWGVLPARTAFYEVKEKNFDGKYTRQLSFRYGQIVDKVGNSATTEAENETATAYRVVTPKTIIINGLNLNYDFISQRVAMVKNHGIITSAYLAVKAKEELMIAEYALYLFKSYDGKQVFHGHGSGVRKTLKFSDFREIPVVIPSLPEQMAIAAYLDEKCGTIDEIIAEAKASIEEYKAWKSSVIFEAVTKGFDPNTEMKNSGVEWIGKVPRHWKICKLKYLCSMQAGKNISSELIQGRGEYPVYGGNGLRGYYSNFNMEQDCILVGRQGALCGNVHIVSGKYWATEHAVITQVTNIENLQHLYYLLIGMNLNQYASDAAAQPGLAVGAIKDIYVPLTPKSEQEAIITALDEKCATIDGIIAEKEALIADMEAYKKSLIFETVTGKRKVC